MDLISLMMDAWGWTGIDPSRIVAENEFGNLIIEDTDGRYWRLCPEEAYCKTIAESDSELVKLQVDPEFIADWEMRSVVDSAKEAYGVLPAGCKFCLKIPGVLGGSYEMDNIGTVPLHELILFSGDIGYRCKDLPDGTPVELRVID